MLVIISMSLSLPHPSQVRDETWAWRPQVSLLVPSPRGWSSSHARWQPWCSLRVLNSRCCLELKTPYVIAAKPWL
jgi:hypothetical protein